MKPTDRPHRPSASSLRLKQAIERFVAENKPGTQLPVDAALAQQNGVSVSTIRRLLSSCAHEGLVVRVKGKGTFVPGEEHPVDVSPAPSRQSSVDTIVAMIIDQIGRGQLRQGHRLPSVKWQRESCKVGSGTVSAAYRRLVEEGYVTQLGRHYVAGGRQHTTASSRPKTVVLLAPEGIRFEQLYSEDTPGLQLRKMESELAYSGYRVLYEHIEDLPRLCRSWQRDRKWPFGLVFVGSGGGVVSVEEMHSIIGDLDSVPSHVAPHRPPVLFITRNAIVRRRGMHFLSTGQGVTALARTMASFMVERDLGTLHIFPCMDRAFMVRVRDLMRMMVELDAFGRREDVQFHIRTDGRSSGTWHYSFAERLRPSGLAQKSPWIAEPSLLRRQFILCDGYEPVFDGLSTRRGCWLFSRDSDAALALEWCHSHAVDVPGRVSIVSLENSPAFAHRGISGCVEDWEASGYLMAHALIGDVPVKKSRRGFIACDARIVHRLTTP